MPPPHTLLPTAMLLRSLLVAAVTSHRVLLVPALAILSSLTKPQQGLWSIENNHFLRSILKSTLYTHFCAGEDATEVKETIRQIKDMGFKGVILTYAREVVAESSTTVKGLDGSVEKHSTVEQDHAISSWREGVAETLSMIGNGDFLALKFTGAGAAVTEALASGKQLPSQMTDALQFICEEAIKRGVCILIDAEQQRVQPGIDVIALDLMKRYNKGTEAFVYNTYQSYLKCTPKVLVKHLQEAKRHDFTIGVKLVRGAYMSTEPRVVINDTKKDTDDAYDAMAEGILQGRYKVLDKHSPSGFPRVQLFLATHNRRSTLRAYELQQARLKAGFSLTKVQYGQLLGMADEVSCTLLQLGRGSTSPASPEAYKCLSWGPLGDCLSYLLRRAVENRDAVSRTKMEYIALKKEGWRRLKNHMGLTKMGS